MSGHPRDPARAVVPAKSGQTDAARVSSHDERRVRWSGDRGKCRGDGGERALVPESGECRQLTIVDGASEDIRSHAIVYDHYDLRGITWRGSCRRTQL